MLAQLFLTRGGVTCSFLAIPVIANLVPLANRSAKDTPVNSAEALRTSFLHFVEVNKANDVNGKLICLMQAGTDMLRIRDAAQALACFAMSDRIESDMHRALDIYRSTQKFDEHFVVRKWVDIAVGMSKVCDHAHPRTHTPLYYFSCGECLLLIPFPPVCMPQVLESSNASLLLIC